MHRPSVQQVFETSTGWINGRLRPHSFPHCPSFLDDLLMRDSLANHQILQKELF
jgi:hypothetical protein